MTLKPRAVGQVEATPKKKSDRVDLDSIEVKKTKLDLSKVKVTRTSIWDRYLPDLQEAGDAIEFPAEVTYASLHQAAARFRKVHEINVVVHVDRKTKAQYLVVKEGAVNPEEEEETED